MTDTQSPWSPHSFERRFAACADPWEFATSVYERGRYRSTLRALSRQHYARAFEPGCAVGVLTHQLARRCDHVIATDVSPSALMNARRRCAEQPNVELLCRDLRTHIPSLPLDLVVFSEVGYYLSVAELTESLTAIVERLALGGELVAVHWLGHSRDHRLHGDEVHAAIERTTGLMRQVSARHRGFRLDRWERA